MIDSLWSSKCAVFGEWNGWVLLNFMFMCIRTRTPIAMRVYAQSQKQLNWQKYKIKHICCFTYRKNWVRILKRKVKNSSFSNKWKIVPGKTAEDWHRDNVGIVKRFFFCFLSSRRVICNKSFFMLIFWDFISLSLTAENENETHIRYVRHRRTYMLYLNVCVNTWETVRI